MQCVQGPYYKELSEKNRIRLLSLSAPRGNIYDRKGNLLAGSKIAFDCAIIPQEFKADEKKLKELSSILQIQPASLQKKIKENVAAPFIPAILKKDIGKETAISISERSIDYPGLIIHTYPKRYYPNGRIGSSLIGYLGRINQKELDALRDYGYKPIDFVGRGGLELSYDNYLKGDDGGMQTEVDSMGRELRVLGIREPEKGRDITVTVDLDLERYVDSLFEGHSGAVIVMDSSSGGILALASKPDFDPNIFVSSSEPSLIRKLLKRTDYPFVNRSISGAYPPGSTFKIVTASAALESGRVSGTDHFGCKGYYVVGNRRFNCWREEGHKLQTMAEGIKNSCNVFFYQVGRKAGVDELSAYASLYGFGSLSGIDLPYEAEGVVPSRAWKRHNKKEMWYEGDTVNFAIGQGYLLVTPIQILRMINVIATEGELIKPFIVKSIDSVEVFTTERRELNISNNACKLIKEGTRKAVEDNNGTAFRARAEGLKVAGKTGTAQTGAKNTHAWFAGFSPIESPKVSLVIFLEHGGKGGNKPSRMASSIFTKLKELGYL
jgi:penicillin-binding protein 2